MKHIPVFLFCFLFLHCLLFSQHITTWNTSNSGIPDNTVRAILKAADGSLWIGTDYGLAHFKDSVWTTYQTSNSALPDDYVRSIAQDDAGNIWAGTFAGGVAVFSDTGVAVFNTTNSQLPDNHVRAIAFDSAGVWLGTTGGLAYLKDTAWQVFNTTNSPLLSNNIASLHHDAQKKLWAGTINGGLVRIEEKGWIVYRNNNSGIPDNSVLDITHDADNMLWMATPSGGIAAFNGNSWLALNIPNSNSPTNSYNGISLAPDGAKHLSTIANGFIIYNGNNDWENYTASNSSLPQDELLCVIVYDSACTWMGTQNSGLVRYCKIEASVNIPENPDIPFRLSLSGTNELQIFFPALPSEAAELRIFATNGTHLFSTKTTGQNVSLPLTGLLSGIYFLEIKTPRARSVARFSIVHPR